MYVHFILAAGLLDLYQHLKVCMDSKVKYIYSNKSNLETLTTCAATLYLNSMSYFLLHLLDTFF